MAKPKPVPMKKQAEGLMKSVEKLAEGWSPTGVTVSLESYLHKQEAALIIEGKPELAEEYRRMARKLRDIDEDFEHLL